MKNFLLGLLICLLGTATVWAGDKEESTMPRLRIAKCEWIRFKTAMGPQDALRLVDAEGREGSYVGDPIRGLNKDNEKAMVGKILGFEIIHPEENWDFMAESGLPFPLRRALDIAVWDLYGHVLDKPVAELLGPIRRDKVAFYAAGFPNMTIEENVRAAKEAKERNLHGYKIYAYLEGHGKPRKADDPNAEQWLSDDMALAKAVGQAVPDGLLLMFYNGNSCNLEQAGKIAKVLDEHGYAVFFDPMPDGLEKYKQLRRTIETPLCGPISGNYSKSLQWIEEEAVDIGEIDLYAGFTECFRFVRACEASGNCLDLHGGFPMDIYQFPLYGFASDKTLPWIGWHTRSPKWIAVEKEFTGIEEKPERQPWIKRRQARHVDEEGYVRLVYKLPGMGLEPDWEWIRENAGQ
ncbi:MAG: enolase C-terminal domain-like protein [Candidatus Sumerlaeia bacterium]